MKNSLILSVIDIPSIKPAIIVDQIEASGMNKSESFNLPKIIGETMACMETKACVFALANAKQRIQNKRDWLAQQEMEREGEKKKKDEKEKTVGKSSNRVSSSLWFIFFLLLLLFFFFSSLSFLSLNESVPLFKDQSLNKLPAHRK